MKKRKNSLRWANVFLGKDVLLPWIGIICFAIILIVGFVGNIPISEKNSSVSVGICTDIYAEKGIGRNAPGRTIYFLELQDGTRYQIPLRALRLETGITLSEIKDECLNQTVTIIHSKKTWGIRKAYQLGELKANGKTIVSLDDTLQVTMKSRTIEVVIGFSGIAFFGGLYCWFVFTSTKYKEWKKRQKILKTKRQRERFSIPTRKN